MAFGRRPAPTIEYADANIWKCTSEDCPCWMREELSLISNPICPLCDSEMTKTTRSAPVLSNTLL